MIRVVWDINMFADENPFLFESSKLTHGTDLFRHFECALSNKTDTYYGAHRKMKILGVFSTRCPGENSILLLLWLFIEMLISLTSG